MVNSRQAHKEVDRVADPPELVKLLNNCNEECAEDLRSLHRLVTGGERSNLQLVWQQGALIERLRREEASKPKTGVVPVNAVLLASKIMERDPRYVNKVGQFWRAFPSQEELDKVVSLRMRKNGKPLAWSHFELLLRFWSEDGDNRQFQSLLKKTVDNSWTISELENHIKTKRRVDGDEESRGGGRPVVVPPTFEGRATRLHDQASLLAVSAREIYLNESNSLYAAIRGMSQHQVAVRAAEILASLDRIEQHGEEVLKLFEELKTKQFPESRRFVESCVESAKKTSERRGE
jgi:hypothetical protein